ncbi:uncharacterized protein LOC134239937 [Saccostrea cucullata]|uniref:uncharacterized protein LOC134239937 n=1 Tax=Saccostrea cuccullata TaxID=36930 RepID=UPI002ED1F47F
MLTVSFKVNHLLVSLLQLEEQSVDNHPKMSKTTKFSEQTKYETQTDDGLEAHQYHVISKDVTANLEPSNEYEEIKSKGIKTYIELEETNPRREEKGSDDLNAYYSTCSNAS